jgi:8-oxo-dGTP pyrophosphatase MutT (NUDIX family)
VLALSEICRALASHRPRVLSRDSRTEAGVALLLRESSPGPELLFIERSEREGDPWSGHMAFPGGGCAPEDRDVRHAAERETFEEVGISLEGCEPVGRLDDLEGRHAGRSLPLVISAFVYAVDRIGPLTLSHEVREAIWFPVAELRDPARHTDYVYRLQDAMLRFPGILVGEPERHIVWGLTYRFLEGFFTLLGVPLPDRW